MAELQFCPVGAGDMDPGGPVWAVPGGREGIVGYSEYADCRQWFLQLTFALDPGPHRRTIAAARGDSAAPMGISPPDALLVSLAGLCAFKMAQVGLAMLYCRGHLEEMEAAEEKSRTTADPSDTTGVKKHKIELI